MTLVSGGSTPYVVLWWEMLGYIMILAPAPQLVSSNPMVMVAIVEYPHHGNTILIIWEVVYIGIYTGISMDFIVATTPINPV